MKYLPEQPQKHVTREYLFNIVNTFDPKFFASLVEEVDKFVLKRSSAKRMVELDSEMLQMLKMLQGFNSERINPRSFSMMSVGAKKRTRK